MWKDGKIVTTVQKVFEPTEPQLEWKPDGNGGFYRTWSGGKLETYGGTGTGRKALTNAEMIKLDEDLAAWNITQEIYDKYMNWWTSTNTSTSSQSVSQYKWPSYTAASLEKVQQAYTQAVSQWDGAWGGQCWSFVNNYLQDMGIARLFKDPIDVKKAVMNSTEATIGSIAIMNSTAKPKNWHVGIVTAINADGTLTLKQSNKDGSEKVFTSKVNASSVLWYFDPQIPQDQALMSTPTAAAPATSNVSAQAKLLAEYKLNPTEMAGLQRKSPASYEALTKEVVAINPNFDDTDYASKVQTVKDFSPWGKDATVIRDFNTATKHLWEMLNATKALDGSWLQFWNKITNAVGKATGNTNITNFETWRTMLAEEAAKVISGKSNFNEEEMQHFYDILDPSLSKKQLTSSLKQIMQGMVERSDTLGRMKAAFSYLPASSKQSITSLLDTRAIQTLKDQWLWDYLTELGITNSTSTSSTGAGRRINSQ